MAEQLNEIKDLLNADEIITPDSPLYADHSLTWAAHKNLHPKLIAQPKSIQSLSKLIAFLNNSDLDYNIRCGGCGSSSAHDVLISMAAFDDFAFNPVDDTVTIGAGQTWHQVEEKLEAAAGTGYAAIATRSSFVGVGGSITTAGLSWLSSEFGVGIDPGNLLDAQVVRADGTALWASQDPDLLWALRGAGGSFAVVARVRVRVFKYAATVFAGRVLYPRSALQAVAEGVEAFERRCSDPKLCLMLYCLSLDVGLEKKLEGGAANAMIAIMFYDAHGEEHGRSKDGFEWAFSIPGAMEMAGVMSPRIVNTLGDELKAAMGIANSTLSAPTFPHMTADLILRAWSWFEDLLTAHPSLAAIPMGTFVLIELLQKSAIHTPTLRTDTAWPHTPNRHVLQLGVATGPTDPPDLVGAVVQALVDAPGQIIGPVHQAADFMPNWMQPFNDVKAIYGPNYTKLAEFKTRYDPKGKLKGPFTI